MSIKREIAGQLHGYGYEILEVKTNKICTIKSLAQDRFSLFEDDDRAFDVVYFDQIGKDYFVLCRPYSDLTKEIEPGVVPLVEAAKISFPHEKWSLEEFAGGIGAIGGYYKFFFIDEDFRVYDYNNMTRGTQNQSALFNYLMRLHFPINLPDGCWKEITI